MKKILMSVGALFWAMAAPLPAKADIQGYATTNVNMRSGPGTDYPAVTVVPSGTAVTIHGCLDRVNWCDVSFFEGRGWVSGNYVQAIQRSNRVYVGPDYYRGLGIPTITFDVDTYWDRHYRNRNFYRDRDRWRRPSPGWGRDDRRPPPPPAPGWGRDDRRPPPPRFDEDRRPRPSGPGFEPPRGPGGPGQGDRDGWRNRPQDFDRAPPRGGDWDQRRGSPERIEREQPRQQPPRFDRDDRRSPPRADEGRRPQPPRSEPPRSERENPRGPSRADREERRNPPRDADRAPSRGDDRGSPRILPERVLRGD